MEVASAKLPTTTCASVSSVIADGVALALANLTHQASAINFVVLHLRCVECTFQAIFFAASASTSRTQLLQALVTSVRMQLPGWTFILRSLLGAGRAHRELASLATPLIFRLVPDLVCEIVPRLRLAALLAAGAPLLSRCVTTVCLHAALVRYIVALGSPWRCDAIGIHDRFWHQQHRHGQPMVRHVVSPLEAERLSAAHAVECVSKPAGMALDTMA